MFGDDLTSTLFIVMVVLAVGGAILAIAYPLLFGSPQEGRVKAISVNKKDGASRTSKFLEDAKDNRRKQVQEVLNQISAKEKKKKRLTLSQRLAQTGLEMSVRTYYILSVVVGLVLAVMSLLFGLPLFVCGLVFFVGALGFPRWVLKFLTNRRQNKFLHNFPDAIDVMVRGLRSGLPVNEAMKIIATEQAAPIGPEFLEVVEGQKIGIPLDQGIERMVERIPLPEVNFLAIVMVIQTKTGGNLSEALSNLSNVLRDRRKMKQKIKAISQEAKSSAAIIGALPFVLIGILAFINPDYLSPLIHTTLGNIIIGCSGFWMLMGVLVMRKMINFKI